MGLEKDKYKIKWQHVKLNATTHNKCEMVSCTTKLEQLKWSLPACLNIINQLKNYFTPSNSTSFVVDHIVWLVAHMFCTNCIYFTQTTNLQALTLEFFHNSPLISRIWQNKIYFKKIRVLARDGTWVTCLTVRHLNHYTRMFSVFVWDCNWVLFMRWWCCPIHLDLIGWKLLHYEKS